MNEDRKKEDLVRKATYHQAKLIRLVYNKWSEDGNPPDLFTHTPSTIGSRLDSLETLFNIAYSPVQLGQLERREETRAKQVIRREFRCIRKEIQRNTVREVQTSEDR